MNASSRPEPTNAREYLEAIRGEIQEVKERLTRMDADADAQQEDPAMILLDKILISLRDLNSSAEVLHQRLDAIARFVPAAARAVSGGR